MERERERASPRRAKSDISKGGRASPSNSQPAKPISNRRPQPAFQTSLAQKMKHPSQTANNQRRRGRQPKLASGWPDRASPGDCAKM